ncbi:MAG TPA: SDR family NAD(P)-dependent oxidoreductase [Candidatus Sulfotelmatobacter sp.]|nr:SDR family NAD(P)-dependent oxidoreductase [Candidatus Sulfotelmatobacter sp.]
MTGASSGIGEALALVYARPGARLVLTGRDAARLAAVERACAARGAAAVGTAIDVTDGAAMRAFVTRTDDEAPFDLVIANAGISAGTGAGEESEAQLRALTDVNVTGVINTVAPLLPRLRARGRGQVALMSSLASFRGIAGAPGYCASKAWVRVYGEALRGDLAACGVGVSVICPGFVRSRMTAVNRFPMPFLMDGERAARIIARGIAANRGRIAFPLPMAFGSWLLAALPIALTDRMLRHLPRKA